MGWECDRDGHGDGAGAAQPRSQHANARLTQAAQETPPTRKNAFLKATPKREGVCWCCWCSGAYSMLFELSALCRKILSGPYQEQHSTYPGTLLRDFREAALIQ